MHLRSLMLLVFCAATAFIDLHGDKHEQVDECPAVSRCQGSKCGIGSLASRTTTDTFSS